MSEKDFAQLEPTQPEQEPAGKPAMGKPILIATLALIFVIICFTVGFFTGEKYGLEASKGNKHVMLLDTVREQQKELKSLKEEAEKWRQKEASTSQVGELTFYDELPKQSVMPEPIHATQKTTLSSITATIKSRPLTDGHSDNLKSTEEKLDAIISQELSTNTHAFRLQLASFRNKEDATKLVMLLKKMDINAVVQRVDLENLGVRYRTNSTTFTTQSQALRAKKQIKDQLHITGIIITE